MVLNLSAWYSSPNTALCHQLIRCNTCIFDGVKHIIMLIALIRYRFWQNPISFYAWWMEDHWLSARLSWLIVWVMRVITNGWWLKPTMMGFAKAYRGFSDNLFLIMVKLIAFLCLSNGWITICNCSHRNLNMKL